MKMMFFFEDWVDRRREKPEIASELVKLNASKKMSPRGNCPG
jgi:hypothetical protein